MSVSTLITSLATTKTGLYLRKILRFSGLNRLVKRIFYSEAYEGEFENALINSIVSGDIIWDVGANQGLYTDLFVKNIRSVGKVIAFEPNPDAFGLLTDRFGGSSSCQLMNVALGKEDGTAELIVSLGSDMDPTASICRAKTSGTSLAVRVRGGSNLVANGECPSPTLVKIDTEGFELDVLDGLEGLLKVSPPRVIAVEIHVGILQGMGVTNPVESITTKLDKFGYRCEFPDASHLIAKKE